MNLGDKLRAKFTLPEWFFKKIESELERSGRTSIICDNHINGITSYAIPMAYENSLKEWAYDNGLKIDYHRNGYYVRHIDVTI